MHSEDSEETGWPVERAHQDAEHSDDARAGPGATNPLRHWLERNAARRPDDIFVHCLSQGTTITHRQFLELAQRLSGYLEAAGIGAGDRVALLSNNSIEHIAAYLGVMAHGATVCTINVEMNVAYLGDILAGLAPRLVLCQEGVAPPGLASQAPGGMQPLGKWRADGGSGLFEALAGHAPGAWADVEASRSDGVSPIQGAFWRAGKIAPAC